MRRILALDGGGVRGIISLEILREVERLFREERGRGDLVLAEVFDLIAGTSTGAIIAACLSWGMTVDEIERLYVDEAAAMFAPAPWYQRWRFKYRSQAIGDMFRRRF